MSELKKDKVTKYYLAKMDKGNCISYYLKVILDDKFIYFVRDKNGVNAWHCGSIPKLIIEF
jgi:hypothetical protein